MEQNAWNIIEREKYVTRKINKLDGYPPPPKLPKATAGKKKNLFKHYISLVWKTSFKKVSSQRSLKTITF